MNKTSLSVTIVVVLAAMLAVAPAASGADQDWENFVDAGIADVSELSGLAASPQHDGIVWANSDSGNESEIYALRVNRNGDLRQFSDGHWFHTADIVSIRNRDWEDLAFDSEGNLWIADIGNNSCQRNNLTLIKVTEPSPYRNTTAQVQGEFQIEYPDPPSGCANRNAESLFFVGTTPYIIDKRDNSHAYRVDSLDGNRVNTMTRLGPLTPPAGSNSVSNLTAADLSQDGTRLAVTARGRGAVVYTVPAGTPPDEVVERLISSVPTTVSARGSNEAIAFFDENDSLLLGAEDGQLQRALGPGQHTCEDPGGTDTVITGRGADDWRAWQVFDIEVPQAGTISVSLAWDNPDVDMNVFLRNPAGVGIAWDNSLVGNPEEITHTVSQPGTYSVAVLFRSGGEANFTLTVSMDGGGGGSCFNAVPVSRAAGDTRFSTPVELSERTYADGTVTDVVIATGADYPDALAAGPLAASRNATLLLNPAEALDPQVREEIQRVGATSISVVGGTSAISEQVVEDLRSIPAVTRVDRLDGPSRYHTAARLATETASIWRAAGHGVDGAILVLGGHEDADRGWADAVAAGQLAAQARDVLLLTGADEVPGVTLDAIAEIGVNRVTIVGGTAAVSAEVESHLSALGLDVTRLAGATRFETALAVADATIAAGGMPASLLVASGERFPDSLAATVAAYAQRGVLVLSSADQVSVAGPWIEAHSPDIDAVTLVGGTAVLSDGIAEEVREILR